MAFDIENKTPPYAAHFDGNQIPSLVGVEGTLGTADTAGTARVLPVGVNPTTGALFVQDLAGASGTTNVVIIGGTLNAGTVTTTLALNTGTITTGSLANIGQVHNAGTIASGSLTTLASFLNGNVGSIGGVTVLNYAPGDADGNDSAPVVQTENKFWNGVSWSRFRGDTTNGLDVDVTRLPSDGTIVRVTSMGTVAGINTGTITTIAAGTQNTLGTVGTVIGAGVVTTVSNLTNGSVNILTGTITSVTNLAGGTVQKNPRPTRSISTYGTVTAGTIGTLLVAPGVGTAIWVSDVSIINHSGTSDAVVSFALAAQGAGVVARARGTACGMGIQKSFPIPTDGSTTNAALTFNNLEGSGTVNYTISYWIQ